MGLAIALLRRLAIAACAAALLACAGVPRAVETGQLVLWEVGRRDGTGGRVHLMGSVHLSDDEIHFDPAVERALQRADTLVLEVAPDELDPARMSELAAKAGTFRDDRTLEDVLAPSTWELLERRARRDRIPLDSLRKMEPWLVGITLQVIALEREGFGPDRGVESRLARSAAAAGKSVVGLESAEAQIAALDSLPLATQELLLLGVLEEDPAAIAGVPLLLDAWRKGDLARIEAAIFSGLGEEPDLDPLFETIYLERNRRMASGIARRIDRGGISFVAVGAAHVVGEHGVPALLSARGYAVRRVPKTR